MIGQRDNIKLAIGKLWDDRSRLEGQDASKGLLPVALNYASHTRPHFQSYRDESGTSEATETNREKNRKIYQGI